MLFLRIFGKGGRDHMTHMELLKSSDIQNLNIKKSVENTLTPKSKKYNC